MKNYKFVFGLLLSSVLSSGVHASTGNVHADGPAMSESGPASDGFVDEVEPDTGAAPRLAELAPLAPSFLVRTTAPMMDLPADHFISRVNISDTFYRPQGEHTTAQTLMAETKMAVHAAVAEDVAEPASEVLLLAGLSALAIAVRRQSKS